MGQRASSAALPLAAAEHAGEAVGDGELPVELVVLVLRHLKDDMPSLMSTLCAAACVATTWREAASLPRLWTRIGPFRGNAAANLTNARLQQLISRARRGLRHLNLQGIAKSSLTDAGLAEALRHEKRLFSFCANGGPLTGAGIAAALAPSRGRALRTLLVCTVRARPKLSSAGRMSSDQVDTFLADCNETMGELRALLVPGGSMNVTTVCDVMTGNVLCTRMGKDEDTCRCGATYCKVHAKSVYTCMGCSEPICKRCSMFRGPLCDDCALDFGSDFDSDFDGEGSDFDGEF